MPGHCSTSVRPSFLPRDAGFLNVGYFGILSRGPLRSLSTLRSADRSAPAQDSLLGWWPTFAGWDSHPPGSFTKGFAMATSPLLLSQASLAQGDKPPRLRLEPLTD